MGDKGVEWGGINITILECKYFYLDSFEIDINSINITILECKLIIADGSVLFL